MVTGFRDGQGLPDPVNGGICGTELGESEDNVLSTTAHDIEEMFLGDPFDVHVKGASEMDCTSFVCRLANVTNGDGGGKFFSGESMFSDELPVNAGDVGTRVYQCRGVNNFEGV